MTDHWTDRIVGDRMAVDQEFTDRITQSQFSRQQWGLIMTAVEFDIENPGDESAAELVADTSELPAVMSELDNVEQQGPMAGSGGGSEKGGSRSLLSGLTDRLLGGNGDDDDGMDRDQLEAAERLADEYATKLQAHLEESERWAEIRAAAASTDTPTDQ